MSSSRCSGQGSAPAPSACSERGDASLPRAWAIRWFPDTSRSGRVVLAGPQSGRGGDSGVRARCARCFRLRSVACSAPRRGAWWSRDPEGLSAQRGYRFARCGAARPRRDSVPCRIRQPRESRRPISSSGMERSGRLLARIVKSLGDGPAPTGWEINPARRDGADGYRGRSTPDEDGRTRLPLRSTTSAAMRRCSTADRPARARRRDRARRLLPRSRSASRSRPRSCARRGSGSRPNGRADDLLAVALANRDGCRSTA
jgi:hypothetical protein